MAVDGNRYVFVQLRSKARIVHAELGDDLVYCCRLHFQLRSAIGEIPKATPQDDFDH